MKGVDHAWQILALAMLGTLERSEAVIEGARYEPSEVLRVWLGETPADAGVKKGMLGAG